MSTLSPQLARHLQTCHEQVPAFARSHYALPGSLRLNGLAWGGDLLIAPFNFLMGMPNFLLRLLGMLLEWLRLKRAGRWMLRQHLGLPTRVQSALAASLYSELLALDTPALDDADRARLQQAAAEPVTTYLGTRNVAADITAATLAAIIGWFTFQQFLPGSVSAGNAVARWAAQEQAAAQFWAGDWLGGLWYGAFPADPPLLTVVSSLLVVMAVVAVVSAFAGFLHDPIQYALGIHQRRLRQMVKAVEANLADSDSPGYRPRDTFVGRVYDVADWVRGLWP